MGPALFKEEGCMESDSFCLRNVMPYIGAAVDCPHVPYFPNSEELQQDYKNYKM